MSAPHAGRRALAAVVATYTVIFACVMAFGWTRTWSLLMVPTMGVPFGDLRAITGATVTMDRGLDPMTDNVGDPWHRPANYPRVWMAAAHALRLTPEKTVACGLVLFGFFIASLAILAPLVTGAADAFVLYLCAVSPAALLAVERGKIDFMVLALVCGAIVIRAPVARVALLTAATLLKIFPVFALAAFTLTNRRARLVGIVGLAVVAGWAFAARADVRLILAAIPVDSRDAYGLAGFEAAIRHVVGDTRVSWTLAVLAAAGALVAGASSSLRDAFAPARDAIRAMPSSLADALMLSAAIYIGSFFAGTNYDYRLVFLLPAVPFLGTLWRTRASGSRGAAAAMLAIAVAMSASSLRIAFGHAGIAIGDLAKLAVLGLLTWAFVLCLSSGSPDAGTA